MSKKFLIVGLGNPGPKYEATRHNIGFMVLDHLAADNGLSFGGARYSERTELKHKGRKLVLLKPQTFMNLSGKAVRHHLDAEKLSLQQLLILTDDLALPFGTLRLRGKGSDGGHNGLKHINELLGTSKYPRLRIGVGDDYARGQQIDYVLSGFNSNETPHLDKLVSTAAEAVKSFAFHGMPQTMTHFNGSILPNEDETE